MIRLICIVSLAIASLICAHNTSAQRLGKPAADVDTMPVTPEREAAAMTFVQLHHPDLTGLLKGLKKQNLGEYQRAIRDLYRTSERLSSVLQRDSVRYESELQLWKISSRIHLLAAQLRTTTSQNERDKYAKDLRVLLTQQADTRLSLLEHERQRAQQRFDRVNEQIERFEASRQDAIESQFNQITRKRSSGKSKEKTARQGGN